MKITLSDIAKRVGVSPSTVQRALNGVEGVGDDKREMIRRVAAEMGYTRNLSAFSLKKGGKTIAIVLPESQDASRYYARYLWEGAFAGAAGYSDFQIATLECPYVRNQERHAAALEEVLARDGDRLDGILTMGGDGPAVDRHLDVAKARGIPVVFVGTDSGRDDRVCCVRTYDEMAGRMAADLLINFNSPRPHSKVVITGDLAIADAFLNAQGFERHILENGVPLEPFKPAHYPDLEVMKAGILEILDSGLDVHAVYSISARNTLPMCRAVWESRLAGKVRTIGSDIFPESVDLLRRGKLNAIIHKRPAEQARRAMQALVNHVVKGEAPPADTILVDPVIVMKSNLECFL